MNMSNIIKTIATESIHNLVTSTRLQLGSIHGGFHSVGTLRGSKTGRPILQSIYKYLIYLYMHINQTINDATNLHPRIPTSPHVMRAMVNGNGRGEADDGHENDDGDEYIYIYIYIYIYKKI